MTIQLTCPACQQPLYFSRADESEEDTLEGICAGCRYQYALVSAQVLAFATRVENLQTSKYQKQPSHHRIYELRLAATNNGVKALRLETPGAKEHFSALPEDELLLLYSLREKVQEDLVWLRNQTTNQSYLLQKPGAKGHSLGFSTGILLLLSSVALAALTNVPFKFVLPVALPTAVGTGVFVSRSRDPKLKDKQEISRLTSEQALF